MGPIAFPGLGIRVLINPVAFSFYGVNIYWYGIIISLAFSLAVVLALKNSEDNAINPDDIIDFLLIVVPIAIVGARLYYVVFSWDKYKDNIWEVFKVWHGGIAIYGAIIISIVAGYFFTVRKGINTARFFDFLCSYLVLAQAIGRWGNFVNQEAYGVETNLPWRMEIVDPQTFKTIAVHPTFLYESLWNFGVFLFLMRFRKMKKAQGEVFLLYMGLYGVGRFWIEGLRVDSLYFGPLRVSQMLAGFLALTMLATFYIRRKNIYKEKRI